MVSTHNYSNTFNYLTVKNTEEAARKASLLVDSLFDYEEYKEPDTLRDISELPEAASTY